MRSLHLALALLLLVAPGVARADTAPAAGLRLAAGQPEEHVPLGQNFSPPELVGVGLLGAATLASQLFAQEIIKARGRPLIGAPPQLDRSVSDWAYGGPTAGRFLAGVPDVAGSLGLPVLTLGYYAADAGLQWVRGRGFAGDKNADHELLAILEGYTVTLSLTRFAKLLGRERPAYALQHPEYQDGARTLSFFSGHTSSSFALLSFVYRDFSDWLTHDRLAGRSDAERFWLGRFTPAVLLYGTAALVGYSRIEDQQHYLSDVLLGAAVGTAAGNLFYALHFDRAGRPRHRRRRERRFELRPGLMSGGGVGLTLTLH